MWMTKMSLQNNCSKLVKPTPERLYYDRLYVFIVKFEWVLFVVQVSVTLMGRLFRRNHCSKKFVLQSICWQNFAETWRLRFQNFSRKRSNYVKRVHFLAQLYSQNLKFCYKLPWKIFDKNSVGVIKINFFAECF